MTVEVVHTKFHKHWEMSVGAWYGSWLGVRFKVTIGSPAQWRRWTKGEGSGVMAKIGWNRRKRGPLRFMWEERLFVEMVWTMHWGKALDFTSLQALFFLWIKEEEEEEEERTKLCFW
jgi:hypothetical protein